MGKRCNQTCHHCHVNAGPQRTEVMTHKTVDRILELLGKSDSIETVDITGGAPELNPAFRDLVTRTRALHKNVIDRCNLTVLFEPGQEDTSMFLKNHHVQIIASLPCYMEDNVDRQRGRHAFKKSIEAIKQLNRLGYGHENSGLYIHLVYNPLGPSLPPDQEQLEHIYKSELRKFDIKFNKLLTLTNMPIHRFLRDLKNTNQLANYMALLKQNFNPKAAAEIMCKSLISVSWQGYLYDCDFNQMLEIPALSRQTSIWDIDSFDILSRAPIAFADHCYGCTAGQGSSCKGAIA
ncbi:MAG: arsenosugar biosynthesis radical SAM protein ArsS [Bdellovibrionales bacterium]|nr:arsenosugar biosynthesis radical SAM protein ArsS [Bdellovibrionales bacterium]